MKIWHISLIGLCFLAMALVPAESPSDTTTQLSKEQRAEIMARGHLRSELLAQVELDLQKATSRYTGAASRHTSDTRAQIRGVKRDLIEEGLYEVKP